jgi:hypothetical protein
MSSTVTTQLERTNLEAHVDLCAERYRVLEEKVSNIEDRLGRIEDGVQQMRFDTSASLAQMREDSIRQHQDNTKILIGAAASVVAGIMTIIVVVLML